MIKLLKKRRKLDPKSEHEIPADKRRQIKKSFAPQLFFRSMVRNAEKLSEKAWRSIVDAADWDAVKAAYDKIVKGPREGGRARAAQRAEKAVRKERLIADEFHGLKQRGHSDRGIVEAIRKKLKREFPKVSPKYINETLIKLGLRQRGPRRAKK